MNGYQTWSLVGDDGISTDDFRFDEYGLLVQDNTVATAMMTVLNQQLGVWWANPAHGSRILELMSGVPDPEPATALEATTREALSPLERMRRIKDIDVHVRLDGNRALVTVHAYDIGAGVVVAVEVSS